MGFVHKDIELAWAAGFFDGEGCFGLRSNGAGGDKCYGTVEISQAHPEVLERFHRAVGGVGNITGPYDRKDGTSRMWYFHCKRYADVLTLCDLLKPYLSSLKIEKMNVMLSGMKPVRAYRRREIRNV